MRATWKADLRKLGEQNVTGMVLDLRGNPGGLVNEAVAVAGRFLRDGQIVVSHHGRAEAEQVFRAQPWPQRRISDCRAGGQPLGFGLRDRFRRAAGSRPRLDDG